jgi:hypothetical protein
LTVTAFADGYKPTTAELKPALASARVAGGMGDQGVAKSAGVVRLSAKQVGLAVERIDGEPMSAALNGEPMAPRRCIAILRQLCRVLSDTHAIGVLHGGLTTDSVWLGKRDGKRDAVTVSDFGLGGVLADAGDTAKLDPARRPTSPERVMGIDPSPAEDIYMLGAVAYEMLTGHLPFSSGSAEELRRRHAIEDVMRVSARMGGVAVHPAISAIVERCLSKMPGDRYEDTAGLEAALCEAQMVAEIRTGWDELPLPDMNETLRARMSDFFEGDKKTKAKSAPPPLRKEPAKPVEQVGKVEKVEKVEEDSEEAETQPRTPIKDIETKTVTPAAKPAAEQKRPAWMPLAAIGGVAALIGIIVIGTMGGDDGPSPDDAKEDKKAAPIVAKADPVEPPAPEPQPEPEPQPQPEPEPQPAGETGAEAPAADETGADTNGAPEPAADGGDDAATGGDPEPEPEASGDPEPEPTPTQAGPKPAYDPEAARDLVARGELALRSGKTASAIGLFKSALARDPKNRSALLHLGDIYFNKSDYRRAAKYLRRAAGAAPRKADIRMSLGDAYYKLGRYPDAKKQYEKAKSLGSPHADKRLAKVAKKLGG